MKAKAIVMIRCFLIMKSLNYMIKRRILYLMVKDFRKNNLNSQ
jgi:hypothetical protein